MRCCVFMSVVSHLPLPAPAPARARLLAPAPGLFVLALLCLASPHTCSGQHFLQKNLQPCLSLWALPWHWMVLSLVGALQPLQTKWVGVLLQPMHFLLCLFPLGCGWCSLASILACCLLVQLVL
jgi:hypothetical protein